MNIFSDMFHLVSEMVNEKMTLYEISLHRKMRRFAIWVGLVAFAITLLLLSLGFIMWGIYALLETVTGRGFASLIVGAVASLFAAFIILEVRHSIK